MWTDISIDTFLIPERLWNEGNPARPDDPALSLPCRDAAELEIRRTKHDRQSGGLARAEAQRYFTVCERIQGLAASLAGQSGVSFLTWHAGSPGLPRVESAFALLRLLTELRRVGSTFDRLLSSMDRRLYPRLQAIFHPVRYAADHWQTLDVLANAPVAQALRDQLGDATHALPRRLALLHRAKNEGLGVVDVIRSL